ncbi:MAG: hypothetical protein IJ184_07380 [Alphaproteobacteria bacterium]|nr:hypothetical protein [Alphaproteobacteria bacterium]
MNMQPNELVKIFSVMLLFLSIFVVLSGNDLGGTNCLLLAIYFLEASKND